MATRLTMPSAHFSRAKKVALITTVRHNVGDDFVREGILYLLENIIGPIEAQLIHKHLPVTARPEFDWYHLSGIAAAADRLHPRLGTRGSRVLDLLPLFPWSDRILNCDILVQSGAPVFWSTPAGDCQDNGWWLPLVERRWFSQTKRRAFLNLACGTCQHYHSNGSEFAAKPEVLNFIRRFYDLTTLTTVRDQLSLEVLRLAGRTAVALPCSSIFAVDRMGVSAEPGRYVALNYMPGGGHYTFGQAIDVKAWERHFTGFARRLGAVEKCVLVCHNESELAAARAVLPEFPFFHSKAYRDYLQFYAGAKYGVMNRVHGAFALASLGKPAVVIGSDTRARMAGMIGLECAFVNDATQEWLEVQATALAARTKDFPAEMRERKAAAASGYFEGLALALAAHP